MIYNSHGWWEAWAAEGRGWETAAEGGKKQTKLMCKIWSAAGVQKETFRGKMRLDFNQDTAETVRTESRLKTLNSCFPCRD